jgi:hypothetical protein
MTDSQRLTTVRALHTVIYLAMAASTLAVLVAGITGIRGTWLWVALALVTVEVVVFVGNGMRCPLTALALRYGAERGTAFDTLLPDGVTRYTFRVFGTLLAIGLVLLLARQFGAVG